MKAAPLAMLLLAAASPACSAEIFGGLAAQDVDTALNKGGFERGLAVQAGVRGGQIEALKAIGSPQPYAFVSVATEGGTNFAAAGVSWKFGDKIYLRPGLGLAIHDRSSNVIRGGLRGDLGSRILFEPELGIGIRLAGRLTAEASWVHVSHARLFSAQNPGMDNIGMRLNFELR